MHNPDGNHLRQVAPREGLYGDRPNNIYRIMLRSLLAALLLAVVALFCGGCKDSKRAPAPQGPTASDAGKGYIETVNGLGLEMIWVPPGSFMMGLPDAEKDPGLVSAKPQHKVTLDGFWLAKYETTWAELLAIMELPASLSPKDRLEPLEPANGIGWDAATEFCRRLTAFTGKNYALPTEAQWEYACRAGTTTRYSFGDTARNIDEYAWWYSNSKHIHDGVYLNAVGLKKPNAWGFYDMHGNVREWCRDWADDSYYATSPRINPTGPSSGIGRSLRGGACFNDQPEALESAARWGGDPSEMVSHFAGLRVVRQP